MQVRNNEITITRGESFTMSKLVQNRDGSPYIISSRLINPYWRIVISSARYDQEDRYVLNKWLSLKDLPRFEITQPIRLKDINPEYGFDNTSIPAGYEGDYEKGYANIAVFYDKNADGVISYKYWEYIYNEDEGEYSGHWVDYQCMLISTFMSEVTRQWIEQNYLYFTSLVDGMSTEEYRKYNPEADVDWSKPLISIDTTYSILEPTRIYVKSNLKGAMI